MPWQVVAEARFKSRHASYTVNVTFIIQPLPSSCRQICNRNIIKTVWMSRKISQHYIKRKWLNPKKMFTTDNSTLIQLLLWLMWNHTQINQFCTHILSTCKTFFKKKNYFLGRVLIGSYFPSWSYVLWFYPASFRHCLSILIGLLNCPVMKWMVWLILKMN